MSTTFLLTISWCKTLSYRTLYILVEGRDDERFFERVIGPIFEETYNHVQCWQYSQQEEGKVNSYLYSIRAMQAAGAADLIIVADLDESPCVTDRKERTLSRFRSLSIGNDRLTGVRLAPRVLIVCREIESWYLAGLTDNDCRKLGIPRIFKNTDHLSKEQFLGLMPERFGSKTEFMLEILQVFDHETARSRNRSFRYFMQKQESDEDRA